MRGRKNIRGWLAGILMPAMMGTAVGAEAQFGTHDHDFGFNLSQVRSHGHPVIPLFEGWYENPDGTVTMTLAYFNLNLDEALHIPLGPNNFIEPARFDGVQPTYFEPTQTDCCNGRQMSVFTMTVPKEHEGDIVWTLGSQGRMYRVPARFTSEDYRVDNLEAFTPSPIAPEIRLEEEGAVGRGRVGPRVGPLAVRVGDPLPLKVWVDPQPASVSRVTGLYAGAQMDTRTRSMVRWHHHQGPAEVSFGQRTLHLEGGAGELTTTATFSEPGEYVLRALAIESWAGINTHCCWTNGYVHVVVTP